MYGDYRQCFAQLFIVFLVVSCAEISTVLMLFHLFVLGICLSLCCLFVVLFPVSVQLELTVYC